MKITHLCLANYYADDFAYQENMLAKYHIKLGHDVSVIASLVSYDPTGNRFYFKHETQYQSKDGNTVIRLEYKKPFIYINKKLRRYKRLKKYLYLLDPEIVFIHGCQFWDIGEVVKFKQRREGVSIFVDNHADTINSAKSILSRLVFHKIVWKRSAKKVEKYTEKFYGVTPARCDFLNRFYNISYDNIELLVMGVDIEDIDLSNKEVIRKKIRNKHKISMNDFLIVTGGRIEERKKIHLLMQAVNGLENRNVRLIVFGNDDNSTQFLHRFLDPEKTVLAGWLSPREINNYFLASDLAVFPGTHSVLWEQAVGTGTPCLFKHWPGTEHIDLGGNCMFLFEGGIRDISGGIEFILENRKKYLEMKHIAVEKGIKYFSYREIAQRAISV